MEQTYKKKLCSMKYMLILTIPIFIELFLQMVVGYSDQFMMSKYPDAVNGITNANTVINMVIAAFQVFSTAAIILISQYRGSKEEDKLNKVYSVSFFFNLITGITFSLIILGLSRYYLHWIKTPSTAYNDALIYSMIAGSGIVFQLGSTTLSSFLKANNYMKDSMVITIIVNILNVVGNYVLIQVFAGIGYPIIGVALSSTLSRMTGFILMFIMFKKRIKVKLHIKSLFSDGYTFKKLLLLGAPSGGESVSYNSSQIIIQLIVNQIVIYSANNVGIGNVKTYAQIFAMLAYMFASASSQAMQVIVGELLGAREIESVKKKVKQTVFLSAAISVGLAVVFYFNSRALFSIFNVHDEYLLDVGKKIMFIDIILEIGRSTNIILVRVLQTSGDVVFPTLIAIVFCWTVAIGGSFLLGYPKTWGLSLGLVGLWIAMASDECIRAIIFFIRFSKGKWRKYNLVK